MRLLEDRVAVVTGGASPRGIGLATARALSEQGARIAIVDLKQDEAHSAASHLGPLHRGYGCDVADQDACLQTTAQIFEDFGRLDALLTFAGISRSTKLPEISLAEYEAVMRINLGGTMYMCQAVAPYMRERGGSIVCVGSIAAQRGGGIFGASHYAASKGGVQSLAKALARELGPSNIRVNAIAPGLIDTDIFQGKLTDAMRQQIVSTIPLGRVGQPDDVARLSVFLASDWSSYITGAVIDVNGGAHIH